MARPRRRNRIAVSITPGQASYVMDRMIADGRVSAGEVSRYIGEMHREIGDLERRLQSLRAASGGGAGSGAYTARAAAPAAAAARPAGAARRRRPAVSAEQQASRQLQGRYLGLIRQIPANRRGQYQRIAKDKSREAAIKEMMIALKK